MGQPELRVFWPAAFSQLARPPRAQMYVVAHEAPTQEAGLRIRQVFSQEPKIRAAILIGRVGFPPIDASLRDVAGYTGQHTSVASWHMLGEWSTAWGCLGIIAQFRLTRFLDEFSDEK
jgi:hypothetical protein